jgi:hypothetical protein
MFPEEVGQFPKKIRGSDLAFSSFGKNPDLLRKRCARRVRETFTEGSGTTGFQKARDTDAG